MVSQDHNLSVRRQFSLLILTRSNLHYEPKGESAENLRFMEIIDKRFLETPWYGSRQMARYIKALSGKCRIFLYCGYLVWFCVSTLLVEVIHGS